MHKNYNSCLHILDMHVERGRHQFSHRKQILVTFIFRGDLHVLEAHGLSRILIKEIKFLFRRSKVKFFFFFYVIFYLVIITSLCH